MIIASKCPYRISLLGGSTDLDWFTKKNKKGIAIGVSIKAYSTIFIKERSIDQEGILNYFSREIYSEIDDISHPIIRECLKKYKIKNPIELCSFGDNLSGGGLGSSSSFSVCLIRAICELQDIKISNMEAAFIASEIEINKLKKPIGRQDQYLCSLGGINVIKFNDRNEVESIQNKKIINTIKLYFKNLYIINTGKIRLSSTSLGKIKEDPSSYKSIKKIFEIADNFLNESDNLTEEDLIDFLDLSIKKSWDIKKLMSGVMNDDLKKIEDKLKNFNFEIKKLLGAGGGGYFLVEYKGKFINEDFKNLEQENLQIWKVEIENNGAKAWEI